MDRPSASKHQAHGRGGPATCGARCCLCCCAKLSQSFSSCHLARYVSRAMLLGFPNQEGPSTKTSPITSLDVREVRARVGDASLLRACLLNVGGDAAVHCVLPGLRALQAGDTSRWEGDAARLAGDTVPLGGTRLLLLVCRAGEADRGWHPYKIASCFCATGCTSGMPMLMLAAAKWLICGLAAGFVDRDAIDELRDSSSFMLSPVLVIGRCDDIVSAFLRHDLSQSLW
eukprot:CAMPEP_0183346532 /NCGR_PEP_ID=MMETSP0164_2-20130417/11625_1 /TAXON_ID=221442 /ORGANISM="Coccolithus pelagicus ssp braarudi, Strain PLY182g" /LENGTH=228 /DNA_ID=CAMNT_0025517821 /DNA_START=189 /DNA_END=876 /DNA_ORIENTATION=-